jgi:hypothetical protein
MRGPPEGSFGILPKDPGRGKDTQQAMQCWLVDEIRRSPEARSWPRANLILASPGLVLTRRNPKQILFSRKDS